MNNNPNFVSHLLEGPSLKAATKIQEELTKTQIEAQHLKDEFEQKNAILWAKYRNISHRLWGKIVESYGLDPKESLNDPAWRVETMFLEEHGIAFLCGDLPPPTPVIH